MNRPAFLSNPSAWSRTTRVTPDPVVYAAAVERPARRMPWEWHDFAIAAMFIGSLVAMFRGAI